MHHAVRGSRELYNFRFIGRLDEILIYIKGAFGERPKWPFGGVKWPFGPDGQLEKNCVFGEKISPRSKWPFGRRSAILSIADFPN